MEGGFMNTTNSNYRLYENEDVEGLLVDLGFGDFDRQGNYHEDGCLRDLEHEMIDVEAELEALESITSFVN